MKEITILSGKGGTGKTSITAALASIAVNSVYCDNDVDAADLHLIFKPEINETHEFQSGWTAEINKSLCSVCGQCKDLCRFDAIQLSPDGYYSINPLKCEGCRLCERMCPASAIKSTQNNNNHWFVSTTRFGTLVHAQMKPGEENSGKLVTRIRNKSREIARKINADYIINDGPPGIGCAAISSITGTSLVLLVIEPSKSGYHDISRLIELVESFKIKAVAIINKYDLNIEISNSIDNFLKEKGISLLAKIPFDREIVEAMINGQNIIEYNPESNVSILIRQVWNYIKD